ncbi:GDP-mannose 4,6-dehydratase [Phenylobacterium sp.]|uniref:GDP-mannose 4,6-dehydratase n=1 Tax=Phenylobacterium sp. TaxID=1871053 RepID=UPI002F3E4724
MTAPRFLVLGSNSFSGATFVDFVAGQGHEVLATSRSPEPHDAFLPYRWRDHECRVRFQRLDLNHDLDDLDALMRAERFTHVVNFAAQSMVGQSWQNPDHWMMTNVVSTVRLHDRLRAHDSLERYVHVTTPEVYGSTEGWVKEDAPFNPSTPYAVSRAAGDMSLRTYFSHYGFPVLFTRAANVFGSGQQLYRIIPRTVLSALAGKRLTLDGGGKSVRSFIHMTDVADATLKIAVQGRPGECYHISTDRMVSIRELVELILDRLGKSFADSVDVGPERPGKDVAYRLDSSKLRTELGWKDMISLEAGVEDTIAWARRFETALSGMNWDYVHKP